MLGITSLIRSTCITVLLLSAFACTERRADTAKRTSPVADKTALLATIPDDEKPVILRTGPAYHAPPSALSEFAFSEAGGGVVYTVEKKGSFRVVHNGVAGRPFKEVGAVVQSPDGKRIAYGALVDGTWRMVADGAEGAPYDTVKTPVFSPDGRHNVYEAQKGDKWYLIMDTTPSIGAKTRYQSLAFSGDSSRIVYIDELDDNNRGRLVVSDLGFNRRKIIESGVSSLICNADRTRVAAIIQDAGKQRVVDFNFAKPDDIKKRAPYDAVENIALSPDGVSLAYIAQRGDKRFIVLNDREEAFPDGVPAGPPVIRPDLKGVGTIVASQNKSYLWQSFADSGKKGNSYDEAAFLTYGRGGLYVFAAGRGKDYFVVANGKEGPSFDRVVSPKFSPDGKYIVYRARKEGKRFVVVADTSGKTVRLHPAYEQVFDVQFTADGRSVAYGVKDGQKLVWKVEAL